MTLTYASTFTGIGGFEVGFDQAGWHNQLMVEIDPHCRTVLSHHFPTTTLLGDICDVPGTALDRPDLLVGGFPCQDTSIAAPQRRGLAGARSGLFWQFHRLLDEHLRLVDAARPRWVVIENPEGLLKSQQGRDAAAVFGGLEDLGYGWAYRVVDGEASVQPSDAVEFSWSAIVEETPDPHGPSWVTPTQAQALLIRVASAGPRRDPALFQALSDLLEP